MREIVWLLVDLISCWKLKIFRSLLAKRRSVLLSLFRLDWREEMVVEIRRPKGRGVRVKDVMFFQLFQESFSCMDRLKFHCRQSNGKLWDWEGRKGGHDSVVRKSKKEKKKKQKRKFNSYLYWLSSEIFYFRQNQSFKIFQKKKSKFKDKAKSFYYKIILKQKTIGNDSEQASSSHSVEW